MVMAVGRMIMKQGVGGSKQEIKNYAAYKYSNI